MRLLVSLIAAWLLIAAGQAAAHAVLLETAPAEGARLADAPRSAALRFNEPVTPAAILTSVSSRKSATASIIR